MTDVPTLNLAQVLADVHTLDLLFVLAKLRWRLAYRKRRGGAPSPRAQSLWFKRDAFKAAKAVILERAHAAAHDDHESDEEFRAWLLAEIQSAVSGLREPRLGRPPTRPEKLALPGSLMAEGYRRAKASRAKGGRPRAVQPDDEMKWVAFMWGLKLKIYLRRSHSNPTGSTIESARGILNRAAKAAGIDASAHLNAEVSDIDALKHPRAKRIGPDAPIDTMARRLTRARARQQPKLPRT